MKLRAFPALAALLVVAACANEAAKGDRNTGTALENGTPLEATATPPVSVDTAMAPASTTTDSSVSQTTAAPEAIDSAAASLAPSDSSAAPTAQP